MQGAQENGTEIDEFNLVINAPNFEVQVGDYLGEDDIVRYEDVYGRS